MRLALWPEDSREEHLKEMADYVADPDKYLNLVAYDDTIQPIGFAEGSLRVDYVEGTHSSPVAYVEGIYVVPEARKQGVARSLIEEIARWGKIHGCTELASDTDLENFDSQAMHKALGFEETGRIVYFRKDI
jgi:aminoglycoside 6'-N-acetyltransferase I